MPEPPTVRSEDRRRQQLAVNKRMATLLLAAVTVVFVVTTVLHWSGYVQITAEASMVGGLADWFAVTALFRRPLGLPIPHTAIIAERKEQFGATLGEFIQESFLTPEAILERVEAAGVVDRAADWLSDPAHAGGLARQASEAAVAIADLLKDEDIRDAIDEAVSARVDAIEVAPLAGRALRWVSAGDRLEPVLDAGLAALDRYLDKHREELRARWTDRAPWWLPRAAEDRMFDRLLEGVRRAVNDMVGHPDHELRRDLDRAIERFMVDLETSPAMLERGDELKRQILTQPTIRSLVASLWGQSKAELRKQADDPDSELHRRLSASIVQLGTQLRTDEAMRGRVQTGLEHGVSYVAEHFSGEIADLVSATIGRWDTEETSRRLELLLGPDLQYIRINGTVVGALAGLFLYSISRVM